MGLGIQVHLFVSVHLLTALLFSRKLKPALFCVFFVLAPCLPYFVMRWGLNISGLSMNSIVEYFYFFKQDFLSKEYIGNFQDITDFKVFLIGPFMFLAFLALRQSKIFRRIKPEEIKKKSTFKKSSIRLFYLMGAPLLLSVFHLSRNWYVYYIPLFIALLFSKLCDDFMPKNKKPTHLIVYAALFFIPVLILELDFSSFYSNFIFLKNNYIFIILILLIVASLTLKKPFKNNNIFKVSVICFLVCGFFISRPLSYNVFFSRAKPFFLDHIFYSHFWKDYYTKMSYKKMEAVFQQIALETSYPAKETIKRMYFIGGIEPEIAILSNYLLASERLKKTTQFKNKSNLKANKKPDGWLIIQHLKDFTNQPEINWRQWLSNSTFVSSAIRDELRENKLKIRHSVLYGDWHLISYQATKESAFPEGFYNIGEPYYYEEPNWLKNCKSTASFKKNKEFYYCMVLPGYLQRVGVHIKFIKKEGQVFMSTGFFGSLLGLKMPQANPDGHGHWTDIKLSLTCNKNEYLYKVPDMGNNQTIFRDIKAISKTINTPLKMRFPVHCELDKIQKIKLSFNHTKKGRKDWWLPALFYTPHKISWKAL